MKPGGASYTVSRCDIQHACSAGVPASRRPGSAHRQLRAAELADLGALDAAAEREHERLHAVADAEHRDAELEQLRVEPRGAGRVDRGRAAGEDQALRRAAADLVDADVVRQQLGEDAALAHAAGDQLRVLAAVVEDQDLVVRDRALERQLLDGLVGGERRAVARACSSVVSVCDKRDRSTRARAMPMCCSRWSCLPSVCSAGATISSARLNSAMSW